MRRLHALIAGLLLLSFVAYGVHFFWTLIGLLFETGEADMISRAELDALLEGKQTAVKQQLIPKIIHQTYKNSSIPDRWQEPWALCQELNEDYVYHFWTDDSARAFVAEHHPDFVSTYDSYPYPIQRADSIRYFVLAYYGGTYIDLDLGCDLPLEPLLTFPLWLHRTQPTGISNDAMGSTPNHPFWTELVLPSLKSHALNLQLPYATVMASTGPLFLSKMWKEWIDTTVSADKDHGPGRANAGAGRVRVLSEDDFDAARGGWFRTFGGSSWHGDDVHFLAWVGAHWVAVCGVVGVVIGLLGGGLFLRSCRRRGGSNIAVGGSGGGRVSWWSWRRRGGGAVTGASSAGGLGGPGKWSGGGGGRRRESLRMRLRSKMGLGGTKKPWPWEGERGSLLEDLEEVEGEDEDREAGGGAGRRRASSSEEE